MCHSFNISVSSFPCRRLFFSLSSSQDILPFLQVSWLVFLHSSYMAEGKDRFIGIAFEKTISSDYRQSFAWEFTAEFYSIPFSPFLVTTDSYSVSLTIKCLIFLCLYDACDSVSSYPNLHPDKHNLLTKRLISDLSFLFYLHTIIF